MKYAKFEIYMHINILNIAILTTRSCLPVSFSVAVLCTYFLTSVSSIASIPALGPTKLPIQRVSEDFSLGIKRQGREDDHSPAYSAKGKNTPIRLHGFVVN
jgi:hypothetical protein